MTAPTSPPGYVPGYDVHPRTGPPAGEVRAGHRGRPVVVLGSSLGTDRRMWDPQLTALAEHFTVVRYDHRGHGTSPAPTGGYAVEDLAGDVVELVDRLGIARFHYVGLSLGAMVGMRLAADHPDRIGRLVLCCTSAFLPPAQLWRDRAEAVRAGTTAAVAEAVLARWFAPAPAPQDRTAQRALREQLLATDAQGYAGCCEAIASMDLRPLLPRIGAPTLVLAGAGDPATPLPHAQEIVAGIPDAHLAVLDDAGHLATVQQPVRCTRLILGHLLG